MAIRSSLTSRARKFIGGRGVWWLEKEKVPVRPALISGIMKSWRLHVAVRDTHSYTKRIKRAEWLSLGRTGLEEES